MPHLQTRWLLATALATPDLKKVPEALSSNCPTTQQCHVSAFSVTWMSKFCVQLPLCATISDVKLVQENSTDLLS